MSKQYRVEVRCESMFDGSWINIRGFIGGTGVYEDLEIAGNALRKCIEKVNGDAAIGDGGRIVDSRIRFREVTPWQELK